MWILESEGDLFQGKRMWLKPGKKYLFGRVKRDGVRYALDHKTISRKHFIISVDDVKAGDSSRIHARTKVTIEDLDSKQGTYIDGRHCKGSSRELSSEKHSIRPGSFPSELVIKWVPCNLAFSLTKKDIKAGVFRSKVERLEAYDVKISVDYISNVTTHVVAGKRNTAKGLQGLIQGKHLVGDSFVDSLVYAAIPADLGEEENLSPLEQDFDSAWPKEEDHLAPPGKEPTERPAAAYAPDLGRANMFEEFQFVFLDKAQFETLMPVITTGQGKALHYDLRNDSTSADELIQYMQNAAGKKGFGDKGEDPLKGGAIMVRCAGHGDHEEWTASLINEVALKLDQRAIDQAEFLDAILAVDALLLKQSVPFASTMDGRRPPPATPLESFASIQLPPKRQLPQFSDIQQSQDGRNQQHRAVAEQPSQSEAEAAGNTQKAPPALEEASQSQATPLQEPPRKKPRLRHVTGNRFKHFDDEFDMDAIPSYTQEDFPEESQSQNASVASSREEGFNNPVKEELTSSQAHQKVVEDSEEDLMEDIFPAAAAMRRRRAGQPVTKTVTPPPTTIKKKRATEIDVREAAKAHRRAQDEAAKKEREVVVEDMPNGEHSGEPANLVNIEMMPLRVKPGKTAMRGPTNATARWDPRWNGRKNFKAFRRAGDANGTGSSRRVQKVIVPLIETKTNSLGLGDQYWDSEPRPKRAGISQSHSQTQSQPRRATQSTIGTVVGTDDTVEIGSDVDSEPHLQSSPQINQMQAEASAIVGNIVESESLQRTRLSDKTNSANARTSQKRPVSKSDDAAAGRSKRQKNIPTVRDRGGDSDSDGMKFKFGRRKK